MRVIVDDKDAVGHMEVRDMDYFGTANIGCVSR